MPYTFTDGQLRFLQEQVREHRDKASLQRALEVLALLSTEPPPDAATLLDQPPGFDGETCQLCRGSTRILECRKCYGSFDGLRQVAAFEREGREG